MAAMPAWARQLHDDVKANNTLLKTIKGEVLNLHRKVNALSAESDLIAKIAAALPAIQDAVNSFESVHKADQDQIAALTQQVTDLGGQVTTAKAADEADTAALGPISDALTALHDLVAPAAPNVTPVATVADVPPAVAPDAPPPAGAPTGTSDPTAGGAPAPAPTP